MFALHALGHHAAQEPVALVQVMSGWKGVGGILLPGNVSFSRANERDVTVTTVFLI